MEITVRKHYIHVFIIVDMLQMFLLHRTINHLILGINEQHRQIVMVVMELNCIVMEYLMSVYQEQSRGGLLSLTHIWVRNGRIWDLGARITTTIGLICETL